MQVKDHPAGAFISIAVQVERQSLISERTPIAGRRDHVVLRFGGEQPWNSDGGAKSLRNGSLNPAVVPAVKFRSPCVQRVTASGLARLPVSERNCLSTDHRIGLYTFLPIHPGRRRDRNRPRRTVAQNNIGFPPACVQPRVGSHDGLIRLSNSIRFPALHP